MGVPILERCFAPRVLPGAIRNRSWVHPLVRASAIEVDGFLWDTADLPRPGADERPYAYLVVSGRCALARSGVVLSAGEAVWLPSYAGSFDEGTVSTGAPHRAIALRVAPELFDATPNAHGTVVRIDARARDLARLYAALRGAESDDQAASVAAELLVRMRAHGVALRPDVGAVFVDRRRAEEQRVADALSRAMTIEARPALVDLQEGLAISDRQLRRNLGAFLRRYRMPFAGWRELQRSYSLTMACVGLSLPGARTEVVARAVGFASATGMCHALQHAGLRRPQEVARRAAELRHAV